MNSTNAFEVDGRTRAEKRSMGAAEGRYLACQKEPANVCDQARYPTLWKPGIRRAARELYRGKQTEKSKSPYKHRIAMRAAERSMSVFAAGPGI